MLIVERMRTNPVTVARGATVEEGLQMMAQQGLRYLPVVDERGSLVGMVSDRALLREKGDEPIHQAMTRDPITVTEYTALEEAARIMVDQEIGALPVMRHGKLVGLITETNLLQVFLEVLGAREKGLRLTMLVPEEKGSLARMTSEISTMGGNILALSTFAGEDPTNRTVTVKVAGVPRDKLVAIMEALGMEIVDVREV
jgi:acetoin utilization protein AcuB